MEVKIESGIPLPPARTRKPRTEKYPLSQLQVGQSFYADIGAPALATHARRLAKETGRKFVVRAEGNGSRVWRKA